jgi:hypothetical protein
VVETVKGFGYCSRHEKEKNGVDKTFSENVAWKNI